MLRDIPYLFAAALAATPVLAEITVTDLDGRTVTLADVPEKVALGFYYEDYLAITGPEGIDKLVAISREPWEGWRPGQWEAYTTVFPQIEDLPDFGNADGGTLSIETIIAADPDVALMSSWQTSAMGEPGIKALEDAGILVVAIDYNAMTLERHLASTRVLGAVMGKPEKAEELAQLYEAKTEDTLARIEKAGASNKKIYVELAQKGPGEIGNSYGNGMWAGVIDLVGGENIAEGQIENWGPLSPEYIISQQPDVILLAGSEWVNRPEAVILGFGATEDDAQEKMAAYLQRPGWSDLPAAQNGDVYGVYHGGNRTLADFVYARAIAKALYPEAFADVDPAAELRDYYETYMPISADGLFVTQLK